MFSRIDSASNELPHRQGKLLYQPNMDKEMEAVQEQSVRLHGIIGQLQRQVNASGSKQIMTTSDLIHDVLAQN